ncbi:MAG: SAM-dependent methyltransferase [Spirochaetes bacterium]|nr:SAM-dependent methyltransferase [Spirochaetota bacterium]
MNNKNCCENINYISGCMVCGRELYYTPDKTLRANCFYCGKEDITNVFCLEGHYVCDECHRKDISELVELECNNSDLTDPLELALRIFDLPKLHMHGPEYHCIVPAVLVTAYFNSISKKNSPAIREAINRGKAIFGGICGTHGACGACIGIGIAYSIIHQVTPYSKKERGNANRMTALALTDISRHKGPRCCKRDSITAIETAVKHFGCFSNSGKTGYICIQYADNDMCIRNKCPYYPERN